MMTAGFWSSSTWWPKKKIMFRRRAFTVFWMNGWMPSRLLGCNPRVTWSLWSSLVIRICSIRLQSAWSFLQSLSSSSSHSSHHFSVINSGDGRRNKKKMRAFFPLAIDGCHHSVAALHKLGFLNVWLNGLFNYPEAAVNGPKSFFSRKKSPSFHSFKNYDHIWWLYDDYGSVWSSLWTKRDPSPSH